jgi:hypothetical protein
MKLRIKGTDDVDEVKTISLEMEDNDVDILVNGFTVGYFDGDCDDLCIDMYELEKAGFKLDKY